MSPERETTKHTKQHEKLIFRDEAYALQRAIFEVYREMECGFLEAVYQECLEKELAKRGIPYVSQKELVLAYKGQPLEQRYKPNLIRGSLVCSVYFVVKKGK